MKFKILYIFSALLLVLLIILFFPVRRNYTFFSFSTVCNITFYRSDIFEYQKMIREAESLCSEFENKYSLNKPDSILRKLNSDKYIRKDADLNKMIEISNDISEKTEGRFDITIQPVLKLWGFDTGFYRVPDTEEIICELKKVDYQTIQVIDNSIYIGENQSINTGAVSKGLVIDKVYELFIKNNVSEFFIEFGGDIRVFSEYGREFKIGIKDPDSNNINKVITLVSGQAVATSGDYERYFEKDCIKYHHIISPFTGFPQNGERSVTVVSESAMNSDVLSTAFFLAGYDYIKENHKEFSFEECYFFDGQTGEYKIIDK